jgi:hypothetical protein
MVAIKETQAQPVCGYKPVTDRRSGGSADAHIYTLPAELLVSEETRN